MLNMGRVLLCPSKPSRLVRIWTVPKRWYWPLVGSHIRRMDTVFQSTAVSLYPRSLTVVVAGASVLYFHKFHLWSYLAGQCEVASVGHPPGALVSGVGISFGVQPNYEIWTKSVLCGRYSHSVSNWYQRTYLNGQAIVSHGWFRWNRTIVRGWCGSNIL